MFRPKCNPPQVFCGNADKCISPGDTCPALPLPRPIKCTGNTRYDLSSRSCVNKDTREKVQLSRYATYTDSPIQKWKLHAEVQHVSSATGQQFVPSAPIQVEVSYYTYIQYLSHIFHPQADIDIPEYLQLNFYLKTWNYEHVYRSSKHVCIDPLN